uniref:Structural maintenance of chromosomes protein 5 n=1 Tax=Timema cristinae TaxID=61476 RepID=A0A7R9CKX1_TIMCR|nr:unnamed protein product [Timema cristinae]
MTHIGCQIILRQGSAISQLQGTQDRLSGRGESTRPHVTRSLSISKPTTHPYSITAKHQPPCVLLTHITSRSQFSRVQGPFIASIRSTYTHVEVLPGPHLNIVIGPNGTGKSSIVCAILLGLKTKPKVLGRGGNLTSFVKTSCPSATIEIELLNLQGKNYIIKRVIIAKDGSSKWFLNGDEKSSKEIEDLATKLKLQVDNLCQFLPQDRVQDFAQMDHHELLINTIKCVGSDGMLEDLEQLKKFRKMELELLGDVQQLKERLGREQQLIARIQGEVDSLNQRESMEKDLTSYKQKHAWLLYGMKRTDLTEFRLVEGKRQEMDRKVRDVQLTEGSLEDEKRRLNIKLKEREKLLNVITDLERGLEMLRDNLAHLQQKQEINPAELENLKAKEIEYKQVKSSHMSNVSRLKIKKMDLKHDIPDGLINVASILRKSERIFLGGAAVGTTSNIPWPPVLHGEVISQWRGDENHAQYSMATGSFMKRGFPRWCGGENYAQYYMATGPIVEGSSFFHDVM